jgi:hypothetical protein
VDVWWCGVVRFGTERLACDVFGSRASKLSTPYGRWVAFTGCKCVCRWCVVNRGHVWCSVVRCGAAQIGWRDVLLRISHCFLTRFLTPQAHMSFTTGSLASDAVRMSTTQLSDLISPLNVRDTQAPGDFLATWWSVK